ncbi:MAG: hypothetical protein SWK76_03840 [Actinomycetota bacterium]|nr:hypothetical protein [Actinomycetota bacterium]
MILAMLALVLTTLMTGIVSAATDGGEQPPPVEEEAGEDMLDCEEGQIE